MNSLDGKIKKRYARILGGGMFGEMRGKLGSVVFARNRGGAYARAYAKPVDPATIAQVNARSNFGIASGNYHGLDDIDKGFWSNFAGSIFNPKTGTMGTSSGINAYVALNMAINNFYEMENVKFMAPALLLGTKNMPAMSNRPPTNSLQANFVNAGGGNNPYVFAGFDDILADPDSSGCSFKSKASINIDAAGIGPSGNLANFEDAVGNEFGFTVFMSNAVSQPNLFVQNPYNYCLGTAPGLSLTTPGSMPTSMGIEFEGYLESAVYRNIPQPEQFVRLTLFATSTSGMMIRIGAQMLPIAL